MEEPVERTGAQADTGRSEAFSDGILAILITLLVFDLGPPENQPGRLLSGLLAQWPTHLAYVTYSSGALVLTRAGALIGVQGQRS